MVTFGGKNFSNSIDLLGGYAFPNSLKNPLWKANATPNAGGYTGCVAEEVLTKFGITFNRGALPAGNSLCSLPAYDINDMDAIQAIKLSLAAFMASGGLYDIVVDGEGIPFFKLIYSTGGARGGREVTLNVRSCLVSTVYENPEDKVVIVRGYDAPPVRHIRDSEDVIPATKGTAPATPQALVTQKCVVLSEANLYSNVQNETTCNGRPYHKTAVVSYKDPVLEAKYKDGAVNMYEPKAFEEISTYIVDIDTGTTDLNVSYQQSATTTFSYTVPFAGLTKAGLQCAVYDTGSSYANFAYEKFDVGTIETTDRFDESWPLFLGISNIKVLGHTIHSVSDGRAGGGGVTALIDERIVHVNPPVSKNWYWAYENSQPVVYIYSPVYQDGTTDYIFEMLGQVSDVASYRGANTWATTQTNFPLVGGASSIGAPWPTLGAGIGTLVRALVFTIDIDRPSIVINDPKGDALTHANNLRITYYPVVIENAPPPVAYKIGSGGVNTVDHTLDIYDNDPATTQANPTEVVRSATWLEAQKTGHTIDISLPFLKTENECKSVVELLYNLYDNLGRPATEKTYTITCGPDDDPELGDSVAGFDDCLRVNEINYSYQDGSSYTVNVTLGPIYMTFGSWNTSTWQRKTEQVQRQGIITWSAGDGCTYRVRVQGLGEYFALNTSPLSTYFPGERVNVTLHNNPVEAA